jgi:hypothetical protein
MSDSLVFYFDRNDVMHVIDPDVVQYFGDEMPPLLVIAAAVIKAGYGGVVVDKKRLNNGRYIFVLNSNLGTCEGRIFADLQQLGHELPSVEEVIEAIEIAYAKAEGI